MEKQNSFENLIDESKLQREVEAQISQVFEQFQMQLVEEIKQRLEEHFETEIGSHQKKHSKHSTALLKSHKGQKVSGRKGDQKTQKVKASNDSSLQNQSQKINSIILGLLKGHHNQ